MLTQVLVDLKFNDLMARGGATTQLGVDLMERYAGALARSGETHALVNNFIREASKLTYDQGILETLTTINDYIQSQPVRWMLATSCEQILEGFTRDRYSRPAAKRAAVLLENEEEDLVRNIRAGALREVMYCESFRKIVNMVLGEITSVVYKEEYTMTHPVSFVEKVYDGVALCVAGKVICQDDEGNILPNYTRVSATFNILNRALHIGQLVLADHCLTTQYGRNKMVVCEQGKVKFNDEEMTSEVFREQARARVWMAGPQKQAEMNEIFEVVALASENFDHIVYLDHVNIYTTKVCSFAVLQYGESLLTFSINCTPFEFIGSALEVCDFIKEKLGADIGEDYTDLILRTETPEKTEDVKDEFRDRITALAAKYKDHPQYLEIVNAVAKDLAELSTEEE